MLKYWRIIQDSAQRIAVAANHTVDEYAGGRVEHEPEFTGEMLGRMKEATQGRPVNAEVLLLENTVTQAEAMDMLWRRETRNERSGKRYPSGNSPNSVVVWVVQDFEGVPTVLYTDFPSSGKVATPTPTMLAEKAIVSVARARPGMDGISYLLQAVQLGIKTPLTDEYVAEILARTGTRSLEEALQSLESKRQRAC
jgi:hypothetical protein